jgi:hypothetical protein
LIHISYLSDVQNQRYATNHLTQKVGIPMYRPTALNLLYVI